MRTLLITILLLMLVSACSGNTDGNEATPSSPVIEIPVTDPNTPVQVNPITGDSSTPPAGESPFFPVPQPGDAGLERGNVYLDSAELAIMESFPIQVNLFLTGNLPTPCHHLRVSVQEPDLEKRIYIDVYSVSNPEAMCIQVLDPFDTTISLGSFSTGHYQVYVNGDLIGEFDS